MLVNITSNHHRHHHSLSFYILELRAAQAESNAIPCDLPRLQYLLQGLPPRHQAQLANPQRNARTPLSPDQRPNPPTTSIFIFIFITDQPSSSSSSCQHSTAGKPGKKPGRAVYKRISSPTVRKSSPAINKQHQSLRFSRSEALLPATAAILIAGLHLFPSTFLRIFISIFVLTFIFNIIFNFILIFTFLPIFLSASSYPHLHLLFIFIFIFLISSSLFIFIFHLHLPSSSSSCS
jgi:hypothetical protein